MLESLRYLISHGLAQAGYNSSVVSPVLSIFTLLESELAMSNFQFSPALEGEFTKLDQALLMMNDEGVEDPDLLDIPEDEDDDWDDEEEEEDDWFTEDDSEDDDEF